VWDEHEMGLPVAWSIQKRETLQQISLFLNAVKDMAIAIKSDWMPSCFIIDCSNAEVGAIQEIFPQIPIYFCTWHVRRYLSHSITIAKVF
jgi:hypothetical protein